MMDDKDGLKEGKEMQANVEVVDVKSNHRIFKELTDTARVSVYMINKKLGLYYRIILRQTDKEDNYVLKCESSKIGKADRTPLIVKGGKSYVIGLANGRYSSKLTSGYEISRTDGIDTPSVTRGC